MLLNDPPITDAVQEQYAAEREADGYVWNVTRLWCWRPDLYSEFGALRGRLTRDSTLTERDRAVLVLATASALGDSYCSFAWAARLAKVSDYETAAGVIAADPAAALSDREQALADWARQVVRDPNATEAGDVARLRDAGLDDREIFEATVWIAFRLAFSTVNDALGAPPDPELIAAAPAVVRDAVSFGRRPDPASG
jgi:uncharacterized peroxidase-related enzyme